jgi:hypothetical protein
LCRTIVTILRVVCFFFTFCIDETTTCANTSTAAVAAAALAIIVIPIAALLATTARFTGELYEFNLLKLFCSFPLFYYSSSTYIAVTSIRRV